MADNHCYNSSKLGRLVYLDSGNDKCQTAVGKFSFADWQPSDGLVIKNLLVLVLV